MWTIDDTRARWTSQLNGVEQAHYDEFVRNVTAGMAPRDACDGWDSNYKHLLGDQYQIRLSRSNRVTFLVDDDAETVTVLAVGGHT